MFNNGQESNMHRKEDHSAENELAVFLDKFLYERFPTKDAFSSIQRIYDKETQLKGIDVKFVRKDGKSYYIDEKAQLHYLNRNLPTFALEILSYQKGYDTIGWLCNPNLMTDLFLFIWPFASQDSYEGITWEHFTKLDCLLIHKLKILSMLVSKGLTIEKMLTDARNIRASGEKGKIPIPNLDGIYYYASYSSQYKEAPINIVISKRILQKLAKRRYIVTKDEVVVS